MLGVQMGHGTETSPREPGEGGRAVRALVLAAGWGTRLAALARGRPKALLPLGRRTCLDVVVDRLDAVPQLVALDVLTNDAFAPAFHAWAGERQTRAPLRIHSDGTRRLEERLGAVGDLAHYLERVQPRESLLVMGGDNACDFDLAPFARLGARAPAVAVHDLGDPALVSLYASVELTAGGRVRALVEKDPAPPTTRAALAIYALPAGQLGLVPRYLAEGGSPDNLGSLAEWLVARGLLHGLELTGTWVDIGTPAEYARARRLFGARGRRAGAASGAARLQARGPERTP